MKQIITGIFNILSRAEKMKLYKLIVFDLVIGVLDIAFLGGLLVVINFYTKSNAPSVITNNLSSLFNPGSLTLIGVFLLLFGIKNWFGFRGTKYQHHFFYGVASRLSKRNIINYLNDDYTRYVTVDSSVQIRKISQQPIEFCHYVLTNFQQVVSQLILIFFTTCAILLYHPTLFLLLLLLLLPPVVLLGWFIRKKLKEIRMHTKLASERTLQHLYESLSGYVEGSVYGKQAFFTDRYHGYQQKLNENLASQQTLQSLPSRLIEVFAVLGFFILVLINKWSANGATVDLLTIGIFMAAAYKIIPGLVKILNSTGQMKTYQFTVTDLLQVAAHSSVTIEQPHTPPISSVSFNNVSFNYKDQEILSNISFQICPGDFAGLSAHSGKGKTTLINLLLGFLEVDGGSISFNGKPFTATGRKTFVSKISYVKQQPFFIHDSILKNITLNDDHYDREKIDEVMSVCGIDKFLSQYPEGLEKVTKENGKNISGGQRQRIMLARALYHRFDLLILDEPFGEMDAESEKLILGELQALARQGRMILFVTHNKASLSFCNKIISLDGN